MPALYDIKSSIVAETLHSPLASLMRVGHNVSVIVCYMGLFALPMLIVTWRSAASRASTTRALARGIPRLAGLAAAALATVDLGSLRRLMPSGGNILVPQGVGPLLLRDTAILGLSGVPPLPLAFWVIVTLLSLLGAFLLVARVAGHVLDLVLVPASTLRRWASDPVHVRDLFVATAALAYVAPLLLIPFYDHHLVPLLPLTFDAVTGLDTVGRYPYATLLPPAERSIKVLMKPK